MGGGPGRLLGQQFFSSFSFAVLPLTALASLNADLSEGTLLSLASRLLHLPANPCHPLATSFRNHFALGWVCLIQALAEDVSP
jgi:hypothetical protein